MRKPPDLPVTTTTLLDEAVSALELMLREIRLCDELSLELFGVTAAQLRLLCELVARDGQSVTALSAALSAHQSTVSELLTSLATKKLIVKQPNADDERAVRIRITAKGRKIALRAHYMGRPLFMAALAVMPTKTVAGLTATMRRVAHGMELQRESWIAKPDLATVAARSRGRAPARSRRAAAVPHSGNISEPMRKA